MMCIQRLYSQKDLSILVIVTGRSYFDHRFTLHRCLYRSGLIEPIQMPSTICVDSFDLPTRHHPTHVSCAPTCRHRRRRPRSRQAGEDAAHLARSPCSPKVPHRVPVVLRRRPKAHRREDALGHQCRRKLSRRHVLRPMVAVSMSNRLRCNPCSVGNLNITTMGRST